MARARTEQAKDERRAALLKAALDEFFEKGFSAARMDDIAARARLSKGAVYLYFDSKEALFKDIITDLVAPNIAMIEAIAHGSESFRQALDRLAVLAPAMIQQSDMPRLMKVLIGDSQTFPGILAYHREHFLDRVIAILAGVIERADARGEIRVDHPELAARLVMGPVALSGIWHALFSNTSGAEVDLETLFRMHADALLKAFSPEATP